MKESIRCCIACILPCGALDVVRIVHVTGRVEELAGPVSAADVLRSHPNHVLRKPPSAPPFDSPAVLPPAAELRRGKIYFLVPTNNNNNSVKTGTEEAPARRRRKRRPEAAAAAEDRTRLLMSDRYLTEILSESKVPSMTERDRRRRGRVGVWRPHLESISEIPSDF